MLPAVPAQSMVRDVEMVAMALLSLLSAQASSSGESAATLLIAV
jgi:hypothetical protein